MKLSLGAFLVVCLASSGALALTPELTSQLGTLGQNLQTQKGLLGQTVQSVRLSVSESHADEPAFGHANRRARNTRSKSGVKGDSANSDQNSAV